VSAVSLVELCPNRSTTTLGCSPAAGSSEAKAWRRSSSRVSGGHPALAATPLKALVRLPGSTKPGSADRVARDQAVQHREVQHAPQDGPVMADQPLSGRTCTDRCFDPQCRTLTVLGGPPDAKVECRVLEQKSGPPRIRLAGRRPGVSGPVSDCYFAVDHPAVRRTIFPLRWGAPSNISWARRTSARESTSPTSTESRPASIRSVIDVSRSRVTATMKKVAETPRRAASLFISSGNAV